MALNSVTAHILWGKYQTLIAQILVQYTFLIKFSFDQIQCYEYITLSKYSNKWLFTAILSTRFSHTWDIKLLICKTGLIYLTNIFISCESFHTNIYKIVSVCLETKSNRVYASIFNIYAVFKLMTGGVFETAIITTSQRRKRAQNCNFYRTKHWNIQGLPNASFISHEVVMIIPKVC